MKVKKQAVKEYLNCPKCFSIDSFVLDIKTSIRRCRKCGYQIFDNLNLIKNKLKFIGL